MGPRDVFVLKTALDSHGGRGQTDLSSNSDVPHCWGPTTLLFPSVAGTYPHASS